MFLVEAALEVPRDEENNEKAKRYRSLGIDTGP
jgi:hypothetical protein